MKEPNKIPLTDNPRCKEPKKIPLKSSKSYYDIHMEDDIYLDNNLNENNQQDNSTSIQQLDSKSSD